MVSFSSFGSLTNTPLTTTASSSPPCSSSQLQPIWVVAKSLSFPSSTTTDSNISLRKPLQTMTVRAVSAASEFTGSSGRRLKSDSLSHAWREILGSSEWKGLLDPINPLLRAEILRYGEFTQACYDAFDWDTYSKHYGSCRYDSASFFDKLDMSDRGYQVQRYLYAATNKDVGRFFRTSKTSRAWSTKANWMGYVAVCDDPAEIKRLGRRDIVIAWRGTVTRMEWLEDFQANLRVAGFGARPDPCIKVESGFLDLYTSRDEQESPCPYSIYTAREQILSEVKRLVDQYEGEEVSITVTGHSLGAALALLSAYDIAEMRLNIKPDGTKIPTTVFSFSGPRVGNSGFRNRCDKLGIKVLRVLNVHDKVPTAPGVAVNEALGLVEKFADYWLHYPWSYTHVGVQLALDHTVSPYLKESHDLGNFHNLEMLLHLVDGYHGKDRGFQSATGRDVALVNKSCDFLKEELDLPPNWRQDENKGLVMDCNGRWVMPPRPAPEGHPSDPHVHLEKALATRPDHVKGKLSKQNGS